uniref:Uncharacterized protein n=1 Tax=Physcomitrium patens TaxID=3218 RepID=A0A2K1JLS0_PHYPA|nr:hypothetical protein PHYPA_017324 [Physcomitrium patens]
MVCFCASLSLPGSGDSFPRIFVCDSWLITGEEESSLGTALPYLPFFRGITKLWSTKYSRGRGRKEDARGTPS